MALVHGYRHDRDLIGGSSDAMTKAPRVLDGGRMARLIPSHRAVGDPSRLEREGRAHLGSLFLRRGLGYAFDRDGDELLRTLTYRAGLHACDLDADAMRSMLREACTEAVRRMRQPARVRVDLDPSQQSSRWFTAVVEATLAYCSRASDDLTECMGEMAGCLSTVLTAWPGGVAPALDLFDGITHGSPIDVADPIWDLVADLRGRAQHLIAS